MARYVISAETIRWSIGHIVTHGDTDIFPHPFELAFLNDMQAELAEALSRLDFSTFRPTGALESLVPKSRYGFRVAHQMYPLDTVIFTAATADIGDEIENARCKRESDIAFSYRFSRDENFNFFDPECKYRHWLESQMLVVYFSEGHSHVIEADISDFYQRIYHHRLENCLGGVTKKRGCVELITRFLKDIRARQSFGIPVGCNASRLLAELLLNDTDQALIAEGYAFTRYVDDYRFFLTPEQDPYALLAFLAEHLMTNEGLSLNPAKTKLFTDEEYRQKLERASGEDSGQADEAATERLYYAFYEGEGDPDDEAFVSLLSKDLIAELERELAATFWDFGAIRILLRCLRLTKSKEAEKFISENLRQLLPFIKDVVLLMEELKNEGVADFAVLAEEVVRIIQEPVAERLPVVRAWLLELFVRGVIPCTPAMLRQLQTLQSVWDQRALMLLRGVLKDVAYFRARKARTNELNVWLQPAFVYAASCLPHDEYKTWIGNVRRTLSFPQSDLFCKWVLAKVPAE